MGKLRLKIALILISAVIAVVMVATVITALVLSTGEANRLVVPMARHIAAAQDFVRAELDGTPSPHRPGHIAIIAAPPPGELRPDLTTALAAALTQQGVGGDVRVLMLEGRPEPVAALQLDASRWMLFDFPPLPRLPPQLLMALVAWLTLFVVGIVGVALLVAQRVTRPFAVIEAAIASVGRDGLLPTMPETGSGEARQTAAALNRLSDRLRGAMASRMRLVAAAGHDLRTPMTRMRLRAEFLEEAERQSWLSDLDELEAIADSAIGLVREENAGDDRVAVALDALVVQCAGELAGSGLAVELVSTEPASVLAGPLAVKRALRNLLTNAATHGGGAQVRLETGGGAARVIITDHGPGIPESILAQVFEPFFRADPARGQPVKGAGLGLAIAREIIERFGGAIVIANRRGGGLEQVVTLPLAPA